MATNFYSSDATVKNVVGSQVNATHSTSIQMSNNVCIYTWLRQWEMTLLCTSFHKSICSTSPSMLLATTINIAFINTTICQLHTYVS